MPADNVELLNLYKAQAVDDGKAVPTPEEDTAHFKAMKPFAVLDRVTFAKKQQVLKVISRGELDIVMGMEEADLELHGKCKLTPHQYIAIFATAKILTETEALTAISLVNVYLLGNYTFSKSAGASAGATHPAWEKPSS